MKKIGIVALLLLFFSKKVLAICPVCTIAVGAGVGLSRWLGIDDVISGLWIGGLTVSLIEWTVNWLERKNIRFRGRKIMVSACYYFLIVAPLYWSDVMGHPLNVLWGVDKLLLGIILGSGAFIFGVLSYDWLKRRNDGKSFFPFQKVAMPVGALVVLSLVVYFLI